MRVGGLPGATYLALCTSARPIGHRPSGFWSPFALCRCVLQCIEAASIALHRGRRSPAAAFGWQPTETGGLLPPAVFCFGLRCRWQPTCQASGAALVQLAPLPFLQPLP